jgi:hypothetical protein
VAAISVGVYQGVPVLDLDYLEDSDCDTDMNVVMTDGGHFVEVQGTAEGAAFDRATLNSLLDLAQPASPRSTAAEAGPGPEFPATSRRKSPYNAAKRYEQTPCSPTWRFSQRRGCHAHPARLVKIRTRHATQAKIVMASNNAGKLKEFASCWATSAGRAPAGRFDVPEAEEPFGTFVENALPRPATPPA